MGLLLYVSHGGHPGLLSSSLQAFPSGMSGSKCVFFIGAPQVFLVHSSKSVPSIVFRTLGITLPIDLPASSGQRESCTVFSISSPSGRRRLPSRHIASDSDSLSVDCRTSIRLLSQRFSYVKVLAFSPYGSVFGGIALYLDSSSFLPR